MCELDGVRIGLKGNLISIATPMCMFRLVVRDINPKQIIICPPISWGTSLIQDAVVVILRYLDAAIIRVLFLNMGISSTCVNIIVSSDIYYPFPQIDPLGHDGLNKYQAH